MDEASIFMQELERLANLQQALLYFQFINFELPPPAVPIGILGHISARPATTSFLVILFLEQARKRRRDSLSNKLQAATPCLLDRLDYLQDTGMSQFGDGRGLLLEPLDDGFPSLLELGRLGTAQTVAVNIEKALFVKDKNGTLLAGFLILCRVDLPWTRGRGKVRGDGVVCRDVCRRKRLERIEHGGCRSPETERSDYHRYWRRKCI